MSYSDILKIEESGNGVVISVKAKPSARKNAITGFFNHALKVSVTTAPEKGKANKSIIKLLAKELDISAKYISLLSGDTSSEKKFLFACISIAEFYDKILKLNLL